MGAILDPEIGGFWRLAPNNAAGTTRRYLDRTLVLETTHVTDSGVVRVIDCMVMPPSADRHRIVRVIEGVSGTVPMRTTFAPAFAYGAVKPWIRQHASDIFSAVGGCTGLVIKSDLPLRQDGPHRLVGAADVAAGDHFLVALDYAAPAAIDPDVVPESLGSEQDVEETIEWWRGWVDRGKATDPGAIRSAIILKAMCFEPTGAMVAAPTTSLPEHLGGERNWDYRFTWIRDSAFTARALLELGFDEEATAYRKFIERTTAGSAEDVQPLYGLSGEIRVNEYEIENLAGFRASQPVRVGNRAYGQRQLDAYGSVLELAWRWHMEGTRPSGIYWSFLKELVEHIRENWDQPDRGIWETRGEPLHFVHSKAMAWSAVKIGIELAEQLDEEAPIEVWTRSLDEIRAAVESDGYDERRGIFKRAFDDDGVDASLLLLPWVEFVDFDDPRMIRTTDAIMEDLGQDGLIRRYSAADGLAGDEGVFIACSFWLVECLARQGKTARAREVFDRVMATANDIGLFSEEYDTRHQEQLGNFPQALSHLSHITSLRALNEAERTAAGAERQGRHTPSA